MQLLSHGGSLCVVAACVVWWTCVSLTVAQDPNTTGQALWPDYVENAYITGSYRFVYFTAIPFPYYECKAFSVAVNDKGYVTFGPEYNAAEPPPPAQWPYLPKLMGVYWSKLTSLNQKTDSGMFTNSDDNRLRNVTYENSLIRYVKNAINDSDFEPLSIITATWANIRPSTNDNDTATFQVLLATDSQVTYAIRGYQSVWTSPKLANVTYYAATYSLGYGDMPKIVLPGSQPGPEVIRLGTKKPNKDPYICVEKTQTVISRLNSSLYSLPPCPCYEVQASKDQQFRTSDNSPRCYQSRNLPQGGSLYQLCCYNMYGHLLNFTKEARVPVTSDPSDHSLQEAYEKCCAEGSGLCAWFQDRIYMTKCANYTPAFNASELPSFYNKYDEVLCDRNTRIKLELSVKNTTAVTFSLMTTFNSSHGVSLGGNVFRWYIASYVEDSLSELRKASYPQQLVIYATDANNMSAIFAPLYKLCLCQEVSQCQQVNAFTYTTSKDRYGRGAFFGVDSYEKGNVNVMACDCKGNGTGRFCEKPIETCDTCLVNSIPGCYLNPQDYCPACPWGYQRFKTRCLVQPMWPDYAKYPDNYISGQFGIFTAIPYPYYECKAFAVQIYSNGYVSFGPEYFGEEPPPPAEWPYLPKLLGIYWSKLTPFRARTNSYTYLTSDDSRLWNVTTDNSLIRYVKNAIADPEFEPLSIIAVTWENIQHTPNDSDAATFQVLLATDSQVTYAIRSYQFVWKNPKLSNVTYYAATYSLSYGDRPKIVLPGSQTWPEVIRLGTNKPNKDPYICVEKTQAVIARLNSSLYSLPPCPCYQFQASTDVQFRSSDVSPSCYQSINLPQGGSLYQLCCYDVYGHLLNFTREARVPVTSDPSEHILQEAYEKCCAEGSGLCNWFHSRVYVTKCANYTPAFNASELPIFYNSDNEVLYNRNTNINVGFSVKNSTGVTYSLKTTFNSSHGLSLDGMWLRWNIPSALNELRKASYPKQLVVYATDANNRSTAFAPLYKLCLCEESTQCQQGNAFTYTTSKARYGRGAFFGVDVYERGNVNSFPCQCKGNGTGRFCEKPVNVCDNCLVQNTSECNPNPQDYCPTCPSTYERRGAQCLAVVEPQPSPITTTPRGGGEKTEGVYLLVVLTCITAYTVWVQNPLTTRM